MISAFSYFPFIYSSTFGLCGYYKFSVPFQPFPFPPYTSKQITSVHSSSYCSSSKSRRPAIPTSARPTSDIVITVHVAGRIVVAADRTSTSTCASAPASVAIAFMVLLVRLIFSLGLRLRLRLRLRLQLRTLPVRAAHPEPVLAAAAEC